MKSARTAATLVAGLLAFTACQPAAVDTSADEAAVRATAPAWAKAYNAGDVDAVAATYWNDAVLQAPGAPSAVGHDAIREFLAGDIAGAKAAGVTLHIATSTVVDVAGDLAYEAGTFTVTDASGATVDTGKFLGVLQKRDGAWKYVRDTWNSDAPPPPES
ncbi:MAG: SgcJ/EcaC family oxidoreductase [Thermoanaerobaculia bacterium]